jgi:Zn-dependent peptidase ImmA (M78 family)
MYYWIDDIISGLKENYSTEDVYELYDYLDIKIHKIEADNILLSGNYSFYYRDLNDKEIVFIRNDIKGVMENFILLHELGHALLHTEVFQAAFNKNFSNIGKFEKQANYFAFKMLNIKLDMIELESMTIDQIASCIGISKELSYLITDFK